MNPVGPCSWLSGATFGSRDWNQVLLSSILGISTSNSTAAWLELKRQCSAHLKVIEGFADKQRRRAESHQRLLCKSELRAAGQAKRPSTAGRNSFSLIYVFRPQIQPTKGHLVQVQGPLEYQPRNIEKTTMGHLLHFSMLAWLAWCTVPLVRRRTRTPVKEFLLSRSYVIRFAMVVVESRSSGIHFRCRWPGPS
jgi:hypothetical protein